MNEIRTSESTDQGVAVRVVTLFLVLVAAWLLWSWLFKPLLLVLGVLSCMLVVYVLSRMDYFRSEHFALRITPGHFTFWGWLTKEIFVSSFNVARTILSPGLPISPRTLEIDTGTDDPNLQTVFANSITLTPGTLALDVHEGVIKVHSLSQDAG